MEASTSRMRSSATNEDSIRVGAWESHHCTAVRCEVDGRDKTWCFVEASVEERDRLIQALRALSSVARVREDIYSQEQDE